MTNDERSRAEMESRVAYDEIDRLKAELAKVKAENNRVLALLGTCSAVLSTIGYDTLSVLNIHKIIQDACSRAKEEPGSKNITGGP